MDGVIYGGVEGGGNGVLCAWNATDLSFIKYLKTPQGDMPWVAVDNSSRLIYSAGTQYIHKITPSVENFVVVRINA